MRARLTAGAVVLAVMVVIPLAGLWASASPGGRVSQSLGDLLEVATLDQYYSSLVGRVAWVNSSLLGGSGGRVVYVWRTDGSVLWSVEEPDAVASVAPLSGAPGGPLLAVRAGRELLVYSAANGSLAWSRSLYGPGWAVEVPGLGVAAFAARRGSFDVGTTRIYLFSYTGEEQWNVTLQKTYARRIYAGGGVIVVIASVGVATNQVVEAIVLDPASGAKLWEDPAGDAKPGPNGLVALARSTEPTGPGRLTVRSAATGSIVYRRVSDDEVYKSVAWSSSGSLLAVAGYNVVFAGTTAAVWVYRSSDWSLACTGRVPGAEALNAWFSPDGRFLAVSSRRQTLSGWAYWLTILDPRTCRKLASVDVGEVAPRELAWSPSSHALAFTGFKRDCPLPPCGGATRLVLGFNASLVTVAGEPGTALTFSWPGGHEAFTLPENGTLQLWARPGNYTVYYSLREPDLYIGPRSALEGSSHVELPPGGNETLQLPTYREALARVSLQARGGGWLEAQWSGGQKTLRVPQGSSTLWAAPGEYTLTYRPEPPAGAVLAGPKQGLAKTVTMSLEAGASTTLSLPSIDELAHTLLVTGPAGATVTIEWSGGRVEARKPGAAQLLAYLVPGHTYTVTVVPDAGDIIGPLESLSLQATIQAAPGGRSELEAPDPGILAAHLTITGDPGTLVTIEWQGGSYSLWLPSSGRASLLLAPASYTVEWTLPAPGSMAGPASALQGRESITLGQGEERTLRIPGAASVLGKIVVDAPRGAIITVEWGSGKIVRQSRGAPISLWAAPGEYRVTATLQGEELGSKTVRVSPGETVRVGFAGPSTPQAGSPAGHTKGATGATGPSPGGGEDLEGHAGAAAAVVVLLILAAAARRR